jgi:hypothetical protein
MRLGHLDLVLVDGNVLIFVRTSPSMVRCALRNVGFPNRNLSPAIGAPRSRQSHVREERRELRAGIDITKRRPA